MISRLKQISLLVLDVDGVLTRGDVTYMDSGDQIKSFSSRDGLGLRLLMGQNIPVAIITGRTSGALRHRCRNLGIQRICDGILNKGPAMDILAADTGIATREMAFMGDDLPDLPAMAKAGVSIAVADAVREVRERADLITRAPGGQGAVREICESILKAKGLWQQAIAPFVT